MAEGVQKLDPLMRKIEAIYKMEGDEEKDRQWDPMYEWKKIKEEKRRTNPIMKEIRNNKALSRHKTLAHFECQLPSYLILFGNRDSKEELQHSLQTARQADVSWTGLTAEFLDARDGEIDKWRWYRRDWKSRHVWGQLLRSNLDWDPDMEHSLRQLFQVQDDLTRIDDLRNGTNKSGKNRRDKTESSPVINKSKQVERWLATLQVPAGSHG